MTQLARIQTAVLDIAYEHSGPPEALPVVLLHGFPYDVRAFDEVVPLLNAAGFRTIVPYLRGYGPTTFLQPDDPEQERRFWYQYYFHIERGRNGLAQNRAELCRLLWRLWSPGWAFDDSAFKRTAASFENADFVDVVIHSYRHRTGNAAGDPCYAPIETRLAAQPKIGVPTISVHGALDDVIPCETSENHHRYFTGDYERRVLANVGHNPPQEAPGAFAGAILDLCRRQ